MNIVKATLESGRAIYFDADKVNAIADGSGFAYIYVGCERYPLKESLEEIRKLIGWEISKV